MTELERVRQALAPFEEAFTLCDADSPPDASLRSIPLDGTGLLICCDAAEPRADLLLAMAARIASGTPGHEGGEETAEGRWRRRLTGPWSAEDEEAHPLPPAVRCVLILQMRAGALPQNLRDLVPLQRQDVLIPLDDHRAALVRDLARSEGPSDLADFAGALRETFLEEAGREVHIGIGGSGVPPAESCAQAQRALELGLRYDDTRGIWSWQRLVAERMLDELPPDKAEAYTELIFNRKTARALDEELLNTAEAFLRNNLNLSDTARQLFIHRSTLMYRLDKLQRATGLDLRLFDDAMVFRLLLRLRRGHGGL